jgi:acyl dehydratase
MDTRLIDDLRGWIGREVTYTAPDHVGRAAFRYFALATGDDNPIYHDDDFARHTRHGGVIAPPTLVCETNQFMDQPPDADGYIGHKWDLPLSHTRFIRGGNDYEFHQPMRPDDQVSVTWRILDIFERNTQRFGLLIFVVSEARYSNQRGELLAINRETNIYAP